jgi:hypothetical protein
MEYYVGLDVSLEQTSICVVNQTGSIVREGVVNSNPEAFSTKQPYIRLRQHVGYEVGDWWWSHFDRIPSALFGNEVRTRCTIAIFVRNRQVTEVIHHTTSLQRWETEDRVFLFPTIGFGAITIAIELGIPKVRNDIQGAGLGRLLEA